MSTAQSKLPAFEGKTRQKYEGPDISKYKVFMLKNLENNEVYEGEAFYLSDIYENEYDVLDDEGLPTGEKTVKHSASLQVINHTNEWQIKAKINLKKGSDHFEVSKGSAMYDLIDSLIDYNEPGSAGIFDILTGSFKAWKEHINQLKDIDIQVKERSFKDDIGIETLYNTLRFYYEVEE